MFTNNGHRNASFRKDGYKKFMHMISLDVYCKMDKHRIPEVKHLESYRFDKPTPLMLRC